MKMEVVLSSPSHFGDDETPFKSEEIREWSRIDRLTGMLERARIETGRWRANNNCSAHSYGKMSDARERNSADGSVMQKAKRQVEIFQSQEPGRSVEVVRASQWSSSRVTESLIDTILPKESVSDDWGRLDNFESLPSDDIFQQIRNSLKSNNSLDINRSPVTSLSKKCSSDDDLSSHFGSDGSSKLSSGSFARDCRGRRSLQNPGSISVGISSQKDSGRYSPSRNSASITIGNQLKSPVDYESINRKTFHAHPRSNAVTVVNISNSNDFKGKKTSIITLKPSTVPEKTAVTSFGPSDNTLKRQKDSHNLAKVNLSGDETIDRGIKKVGFCKTEVHFAADSGKVNIVETDGKPPPTNRFRRRRRNSNVNGNGRKSPVGNNFNESKILARKLKDNDCKPQVLINDNDSSGAYCVVDLESKKFWTYPDKLDKFDGNHKTIVSNKSLVEDKTKDLSSPKAVSQVLFQRKLNSNDFNIVTKDSDDNKVLSTIVKTHEPTIARVEDNISILKKKNEFISKFRPSSSSSLSSLKRTDSNETKNLKKHKNESIKYINTPVYVNVFNTCNGKAPIYENYRVESENKVPNKISKVESKVSSVDSLNNSKATLEKKKNKAKGLNKIGKPSSTSLTCNVSNGFLKSQRDLNKNKLVKKTPTSSRESSLKLKPIDMMKTGSTRSKNESKPTEVVYSTVVFNMKNEKLNPKKKDDKPTGPRYINDLLCGNKSNRTTTQSKRSEIFAKNNRLPMSAS